MTDDKQTTQPANENERRSEDELWKEFLSVSFYNMLRSVLPDLANVADTTKPVRFLETELRRLARFTRRYSANPPDSRKFVDILAEVPLISGENAWILLHVEIQGRGAKENFPLRMHRYRCLLEGRFNRPVAGLAILVQPIPADQTEGVYRWEGYGSEVTYRYPVVFHHAALVSVPLSVEQPRETFDINCGGFLNILQAARANGCRVIYASSSAVYGDHPELPKRETSPLAPLSPYGLAKMENEQWAALYWKQYGVPTIGFRYFNIYGPGQDPHGAYAAVIAAWSAAFRRGEKAIVYGDGTATRDFCFVGDVVQANVLAAGVEDARAFGSVFNIGSGRSVTLLQLFKALQHASDAPGAPLAFAPSRPGDILHSSADIERACAVLGYTPRFPLEEGLRLLLNAEQR